MKLDPTVLLQYCETETQERTIRAVIEHGSARKAAVALGVQRRGVDKIVNRAKSKAERHGYSPEFGINRPVPKGLKLSGLSDMRENELGKPIWYKFSADHIAMADALADFTKAFVEDIQPLPPIEFNNPAEVSTDVIPWFQIGDAHLGMLAHEWEVGHNFDLKIAEQELQLALLTLIDRAYAASPAERCVIQDMGDFTHYENSSGTTEASGHALDVDGRFPKMIDVYARLMRRIIEHALSKYKYVDVIVNQGNHSRTNDQWMAVFLRHVYENTKRLHVLNNSSVFIPYRMGNTFVLCHHTDKCKPTALAGVMANDFAHDWGETKYHYIDGGHIHHSQVKKEFNGATYESWNQLAPSDKYAHDGGWRSRSCLTCVFRSKTYGESGRITITAEEIKDMIGNLEPGTTPKERRKVHTV